MKKGELKMKRSSNCSAVCSSGVRFGVKKEKTETKKVREENPEQLAFVEVCPMYGLSPDFYQEGCLTASGEYCELVGLSGKFARLRSMDGSVMMLPFEEVLEGIKKELSLEEKEISSKLELLCMDEDSEASYKAAIRKRINCVNKAMDIWNGTMEEISDFMGVPLFAGWCDSENLYEFVSFRDDKDRQYILENLDVPAEEPTRFKRVTFERLLEGLKRNASANKDAKLLNALETARPADKKDDGGPGDKQLSLFDLVFA